MCHSLYRSNKQRHQTQTHTDNRLNDDGTHHHTAYNGIFMYLYRCVVVTFFLVHCYPMTVWCSEEKKHTTTQSNSSGTFLTPFYQHTNVAATLTAFFCVSVGVSYFECDKFNLVWIHKNIATTKNIRSMNKKLDEFQFGLLNLYQNCAHFINPNFLNRSKIVGNPIFSTKWMYFLL